MTQCSIKPVNVSNCEGQLSDCYDARGVPCKRDRKLPHLVSHRQTSNPTQQQHPQHPTHSSTQKQVAKMFRAFVDAVKEDASDIKSVVMTGTAHPADEKVTAEGIEENQDAATSPAQRDQAAGQQAAEVGRGAAVSVVCGAKMSHSLIFILAFPTFPPHPAMLTAGRTMHACRLRATAWLSCRTLARV